MIAVASACACSLVTPGFNRAMAWNQPLPRCSSRLPPIISRCIASGTHAVEARPRNAPMNPFGATPMMVIGVLLIVTCWPIADSLPAKRCCQ